VWGVSIGCPGWNSCAEMINNLICFAGCELEWLKNAFLEWVEETINKIKIVLTNVATGLINTMESLSEAAAFVLNTAQAYKDFVFGSVDRILEEAIESLVFEISLFELKAEMTADFRFCFSFALKVKIATRTHEWDHSEAKICLHQIMDFIVKTILGKDNILSQFLDFDARQDQIKGRAIAVDEASTDLTAAETNTEDKVDLETGRKILDDSFKRHHLPPKNIFKFISQMKMKYYDKLTYEELSFLNRPNKMKHYNTKPNHIMKTFKQEAPWHLSQRTFDAKRNNTPVMASDVNEMKRTLVLGSATAPCERIKRALHSYAAVTSGLMHTVQSMVNLKHQSKIQRRNDIQHLAKLYAKTHNLGTRYTNYSPKQKRDINYWYDKIRKGYESHGKITKRTLQRHEHRTLPLIKSQLDDILKHGLNTSFVQYTAKLHEHAIEGYKRSNIPSLNQVNGERLLHSINKNLTMIVFSEHIPLTHMQERLHNVNAAIRSMNIQTMQCHD